MKRIYNQFEFVNLITGNVISYLSLKIDLNKEERNKKLESRKNELAVSHGMSSNLIFWQDHDHALR